MCFFHKHFQRGRSDLLPLIKRKRTQNKRVIYAGRDPEPSEIVQKYHSLIGKLSQLESTVVKLNEQNQRVTEINSIFD